MTSVPSTEATSFQAKIRKGMSEGLFENPFFDFSEAISVDAFLRVIASMSNYIK